MSLLTKMMNHKHFLMFLLLLVCFPLSGWAAENNDAPSHFAVVDGETITYNEFQSAFQAGIRKKFYHGKIPEEQIEAFKKEVSQALIDRVLLVQEAKRQKIALEKDVIDQQLAEYEKRYQSRPFWQQHKEDVLKGLRAALEEENRLKGLETKTKDVPLPGDAEAKEFYNKNKDLFTTPEKMRVSVILLKVSPASPAAVWDAAHQEAKELIARLDKGSDFAELARIHSGDETASNGGDMGFIHSGMLAKPAQVALDKLSPGGVSEPVMLLRGIGIFKLHEKLEPTLNSYESVAERAKKLLQREKAKLAWSDLVEQLRSQAKIEINTAALSTIKKS